MEKKRVFAWATFRERSSIAWRHGSRGELGLSYEWLARSCDRLRRCCSWSWLAAHAGSSFVNKRRRALLERERSLRRWSLPPLRGEKRHRIRSSSTHGSFARRAHPSRASGLRNTASMDNHFGNSNERARFG